MRIVRAMAGCALLVVGIGCAARSVGSPGPGWLLLDQRTVTDRADHDLIMVTAARGDFRSIKLTVQRAAVDFHRVVVHYGNGGDDAIDIATPFRPAARPGPST